jgi:hypothetical protein
MFIIKLTQNCFIYSPAINGGAVNETILPVKFTLRKYYIKQATTFIKQATTLTEQATVFIKQATAFTE